MIIENVEYTVETVEEPSYTVDEWEGARELIAECYLMIMTGVKQTMQ